MYNNNILTIRNIDCINLINLVASIKSNYLSVVKISFENCEFYEDMYYLFEPLYDLPCLTSIEFIHAKCATNIIKCNFSPISYITELVLDKQHCSFDIDFTQLPNLKSLLCSVSLHHPILDLSQLTLLEEISCNSSGITYLIVPSSVIYIECKDNNLTDFDLSHCNSLKYLDCKDNMIDNIAIPSSLVTLDINNNKLKQLDLSHTQICYITCINNMINNMILPRSVIYVDCSSNNLHDIYLINYHNLAYFACSDNNVEEFVIVSDSLIKMKLCKNIVGTIDIRDTPNLESLVCNNNKLYEIDGITRPNKLRDLVYYGNNFDEVSLIELQTLESVFA